MVPLRREELGPTVVGRDAGLTFGLAARGGIAVAAIGHPRKTTLAVCSTVDLSLLARLTLPENVSPGTLAITPDEEIRSNGQPRASGGSWSTVGGGAANSDCGLERRSRCAATIRATQPWRPTGVWWRSRPTAAWCIFTMPRLARC